MDYKQAYQELLNTVMDNSDDIPISTLQKAQQIHSSVDEDTAQDSSASLTVDEWNAMPYMERVELKQNSPEAYQAALQGNFKEGN